jgi:hypothetical protein
MQAEGRRQQVVPLTPVNRAGNPGGLFPVGIAFPGIQAGRRSSLHFRGPLRVRSGFGLGHVASIRPVPQSSCSSAIRIQAISGVNLPPLASHAIGGLNFPGMKLPSINGQFLVDRLLWREKRSRTDYKHPDRNGRLRNSRWSQ